MAHQVRRLLLGGFVGVVCITHEILGPPTLIVGTDSAFAVEKSTANRPATLPIWELSATHDSESWWREMRVERRGEEVVINFRSVRKGSRSGWVYSIILYGPEELATFKRVMAKYCELVKRSQTEPFALRKQQLGHTTQHEFWLHINAQRPVLEFSDPKNIPRAGMPMLGQDTVEQFVELSKEYEELMRLLDMLQKEQSKP